MNPKFASLFKVLIVATLISVTAGCASVQDALAPGIVAQAKSAGGESIAAENPALIPGSVDLSISRTGSGAAYNGALVPGSVDLAISKTGSAAGYNGALVPAGTYAPRFRR
jgi:hypothetical protein